MAEPGTGGWESGREAALARYEADKAKHLADLIRLTKIPSVSFDGFDPREVERSAECAKGILEAAGFEHVEIMRVPGTHPYVYGDWLKRPGAPTVLLYAHHDVQPPLREELWKTPPFEAVEKDGRLFARGIADDKAGVIIHAASVAAWLRTSGSLPVNVKVIIEGEEEIGSTHLGAFLEKYRDRLRADCVVLTDCSNFDTGLPSLTTTLRGLISMDVTVTALDHPLHSGMWGGPVPDPVQGLAKILAKLSDESGRVAVPGIWDDVVPPSAAEMEDMRKLGMQDGVFREQAGIGPGVELFAKGSGLLAKMWREPSIAVNSIQAGGKKIAGNVIMDSAWARVGLRLVPDMQHAKAMRLLTDFIRANCPWGLKVEVVPEQGTNPWMTKPDHPVFAVAKKSLGRGYGREAVLIGCGGTIPFVDSFTRVLGDIPALLVGIEDPYTNAHSENESLGLADFHSSVRSQIHFFADLAAASEADPGFWAGKKKKTPAV
ncbi:MAG TPA: M20/M25/M40 family metallo-hydrolase [Fibrobacteria bacterium]|nr:M20/M25/M40 family metallo-hydrolase [Fibrobacteria bacterium]